MATTAKEKFDAAVKVIHSLPKNGPFQPSYEMMLSFYGFYKQATEGACTKPKPWSFDVVNRKKWDAWNKLGNMPREEAMLNYVEELKKIVEAMPQDDNVRDFMEQLGSFYEIVEEKSPVEEKARQNHISLGGSTGTTPEHSSSEISEHDEEDFNHSRIIDSVIKERGEQDSKETNNNERLQRDNLTYPVNSENESIPSVTVNGQEEEKVVDSQENVVLVNGGGKLTSESESDEEFCDTSDQPSQESSTTGELETNMAASTPLKAEKSSRIGNHVHFNTSTTLRTDAEVYQQTLSPISSHHSRTNEQLSISGNFPFGIHGSHDPVSDSLLVHAPTDNSLNVTFGSDLNHSLSDTLENLTNSQTSNVLSNSYPSYIPDGMQTSRTHGGGENSPPGGSSSRVQGHPRSQRSTGQIGSRREFTGFSSSYPPGSGSGGDGGRDQGYPPPQGSGYGGINEQIAIAVIRLQQDMIAVSERLGNLEALARDRNQNKDKKKSKVWNSNWWPFPSLTGRTFFFVLIWPVIVHWLLTLYSRRRHNRKR